jgi:hypothetical protein
MFRYSNGMMVDYIVFDRKQLPNMVEKDTLTLSFTISCTKELSPESSIVCEQCGKQLNNNKIKLERVGDGYHTLCNSKVCKFLLALKGCK